MVLQVVPGHVFRKNKKKIVFECLVKVTGMVVFYMKGELTKGKIIMYYYVKRAFRETPWSTVRRCVCVCLCPGVAR